MDYIWVIWGIVLISAIGTIVAIYEIKTNKKVESSSLKIQELKELNKQIGFNNIKEVICIKKHYDNKSNYNKIEPAYLMSAELRNNMEHYAKYIHLLQENRDKEIVYARNVDLVFSKQHNIDYVSLDISEANYVKREARIFNKLVLHPSTDCRFEVVMSYSSPKGKVNLSKSSVFNFDQLVVSFNSISRSYLDRKTYSNLAKVERGEVSDSLRYDVLNRDGFRCVVCGASSNEGARLHVDHIIPIAKGGKSEIGNLRTLCERCNMGKSDKIETGFDTHGDIVDRCPICKGKLVLRKGRYGDFYGCENYPDCKFTKK